ncbi:MAG: hydrocarbon degradation protein [Gammaproteobacteria bacterium]|nr:hydrocarbon degradation protein [Gammaproteobacteria bacterium]
MIISKAGIGSVLLGLAVSSPALATNGYFSHGWGTKSKAMAGVAAALSQDTLAAATNPAGMSSIGTSMDLGLALSSPSDRGYMANNDFGRDPNTGMPTGPFVTPGKYTSNLDWFLIPSFGYNRVLDDKMTIGVSIFGNGGMNTKYTERPVWENFALPPNTTVDMNGNPIGNDPTCSAPNNANPCGVFTAQVPTGVELQQLFVEVPFTYKLNDRHAFGIAPVFAAQSFEAKGLQPFMQMSVDPGNVTNNGTDWSYGFGLHLGWVGDLSDKFTLGASYRTKMWMSEFDDYSGLFAEGGEFDIPAMLALGLSYKINPGLVVAFDYQRIFYGDIDSLANSNNTNISGCIGPGPKASTCLGGDNGLGFGWESMDVYKLGLLWDYNPKWSFRGGVSYASDFAPGGEGLFNVLAPATIKWHYTLGASYRVSESNEFNLSFAYMPEEELNGQNDSVTGVQTGSVFMEQKEIEISWTHRF